MSTLPAPAGWGSSDLGGHYERGLTSLTSSQFCLTLNYRPVTLLPIGNCCQESMSERSKTEKAPVKAEGKPKVRLVPIPEAVGKTRKEALAPYTKDLLSAEELSAYVRWLNANLTSSEARDIKENDLSVFGAPDGDYLPYAFRKDYRYYRYMDDALDEWRSVDRAALRG